MPVLRIAIHSAVLALILAAPAGADGLPASVRACIGLADPGQRLACYDREVARLIAPADTFTQSPVAAAPGVPAPPTTYPTAPTAPTAPPQPPAVAHHLTAKVSAVRQAGDNLVVTLDNGDVWEQIESVAATSRLSVRPGDVVQLDKELGAWVLSNRYGDYIQVRQRPRQSP